MPARPLRIAVDGTAYDPPVTGVGWHVYHLVRSLGALGAPHRFTVLHTPGGRDISADAPEQVRFVEVPAPIRWLRLLWRTVGVPPAQLFAGRFDVIHCPFFLPLPSLAKPFVITIHDLGFLLHRERTHPANVRVFSAHLPRAARRAAGVIVLSETVRDQVIEHLRVDPARVHVIPAGVDPLYERPVPPDHGALERAGVRQPYILFVGTIEPRKDVPTLIAAFAALRRGGRIPHRLVLAGAEGWDGGAARRAAAAHGVEGETDWLGYVDRALLPSLYRGADLFVFPSIYEGFGLPPLEAMACGTPVVSSDAACLPETLGEAPFYFPAGNASALAEQIERVLSREEDRRAAIERGRRLTDVRSWSAAARATLDVLECAADEGRHGRTATRGS